MKRYIEVHELASYVGDVALYSPVTFLYIPAFWSLVPTYLDQALLINIVCLCVTYLNSKDTSPAPSRPSHASLSPVELGFPITYDCTEIGTHVPTSEIFEVTN